LARFAGQGLHQDLELANHGLTNARLEIVWEIAADFADLIEARDGKRQQYADVATNWRALDTGGGELRFDYLHPKLNRGALLTFESSPPRMASDPQLATLRWDDGRLTFHIDLDPQQTARFCLTVAPIRDGQALPTTFSCDGFESTANAHAASWTAQTTRIETPTSTVRRAWDRAVADLGGLALGDGATRQEQAVPAAGIPLFGTLFGRDVLTTALQSLIATPTLAEGALRLVARHIGEKDDDFFDEQPGRVPQQVRDNPLAVLGITPWLHDFGDYAAPCDFVILVGAHHFLAGDDALTREFLEPAKRVLDWLDRRADLDGDGFLEYRTRSEKGQRHQGWKDSGNAVVYEDGRQVEPPIAPCEIQGYWYAAKLMMAEVLLALGHKGEALSQFRGAMDLKRRFNERFWMDEERFYAFALDSDKRQVRSVASNVGHCLATGIIAREHAADVVQRLMAPDMFSGWGIRTLSAHNPAFNPFSYHLGTVWPVENATMAFGMKRYGFAAECNVLARGLFDATTLFEHLRLPEALGGQPRDARHPHPGIYPDACAPQAWSASAVFWLVQAMLGLWTYAPLHAVVVDPDLPAWLPRLTLRGLRIGDSRVSIQFKRDSGGSTDFRVVEREGSVRVIRQPAPESVTASMGTRARDLVESLLPGH
jgi:glycogen debranching enzyme